MFDTHTTLLERMATISPGVRQHITGELWQLNIDQDEITTPTLVNECFSILIGEAYELGLEFYAELAELCDSLYHLDMVVLLCEVIFPTPFYISLTEDPGFKRWVQATFIDAATTEEGDSAIGALLYYLAVENPKTAELFTETYQFLQDKLTSTPSFLSYVERMLEVDNLQFNAIVDPATITSYLTHSQTVASKLLQAVDRWRQAGQLTDTVLKACYNSIDVYRSVASAPDTLTNYVWLYEQTQQAQSLDDTQQVIIVKLTREFESALPFTLAYYTAHAQPIDATATVLLLLGCLVDATTPQTLNLLVTQLQQQLQPLGITALGELRYQRLLLTLLGVFSA